MQSRSHSIALVDDQTTGPRAPARPAALAPVAAPPLGVGTRTRPPRPIRFTPSRTDAVPAPPAELQTANDQPSLLARVGAWVFIAIGWAIFAAWWVIVLQRESARALGTALGLLAAILVTSAIAMTLWTRHNIRIAKKGKRGHSSRFIPMHWDRDTLGRRLAFPDAEGARTAGEVRVVLEGNTKRYVVVDAEEL